jgi:hypothetical protein
MTEEQRRWLLIHLNNNRGGGLNSGGESPPLEQFEFVAQPINLDTGTIGITQRDGAVLFQNSLTGRMWCVGGWDVAQFTPIDTTNQQWYSDNGGTTWIQAADAPWTPRHDFGLRTRTDGTIVLFGGDNNNPPPPKDAWTWSPLTETWTNVTMDWGVVAGTRAGYANAIDSSNAIYIIGGSTDNNIVKSTDNGATWTVFATIPALYNVNYGCAEWFNGELYVICGQSYPDKWFKVSSSGVVTTLPTITGEMAIKTQWAKLRTFEGRLFFLDGTGSSGNGNKVRVMDASDNSWLAIGSFMMRPRHAAGVEVMTYSSEEAIYIVTGTGAADSNKVTADTYVPLENKCVYSLMKAVTSYSGFCIKVKRSSDNTESDIGFVGDDLDTTTLLSFVGAGDGLVTKWYDQSGNGYDLAETTVAPLIVVAGVLQTDNGKPAIYFDTTSKKLSLSSALNLTSKYALSTVMNLDAGNKIVFLGNSASCYGFYNQAAIMAHNNGNANPFYQQTTSKFTTGSQRLLEIYRNRQTANAYDNATIKTMTVSGSSGGFAWYWDTDFYFLRIGVEYGFGYAFTGKIQELNIKCGVIEPTSAAENQADINARWGIY